MSRPLAYLSVKNYWTYQHYKDRRPPWIKLYRKLLDDEDFIAMSLSSQRHYMILLLVASDTDNRIPQDGSILKYLMKAEEEPDLSELRQKGFVFPWDKIASARPKTASKGASTAASKTASKMNSKNALSETESETETETEKKRVLRKTDILRDREFHDFWKRYPKKRGKLKARLAWNETKHKPPLDKILAAIEQQCHSDQWTRAGGQFIPYPEKWLRDGCWTDELPERPSSNFRL